MSLQISNILFPTDFSETASKALPYAIAIAKQTGAKLTLMHSIEEPYNFAPLIEEFTERAKEEVRKKLENITQRIHQNDPDGNIQIDKNITFGPTVLSIIEEAEEMSADLIIMGTTGASGFKKMLFGSQTSEVILDADIPVLAVPAESEFDGLPHITFLTDYNDGDLLALEDTTKIAGYFNAEVTSLHVEKDLNLRAKIKHQGFENIASKRIDYESLKFKLIAQDGLVAGINEFLTLEQSSLLTLVKYKKSFFQKLVNKNHSKEMSFYAKLPILVLPGQEPY